jgi:hypothetical protein
MTLIVHPLFANGFQRVFQRSASVIGSDNNAIARIASARNVDFTTAREMYEAEQYARQETLDGAIPTTDTYGD